MLKTRQIVLSVIVGFVALSAQGEIATDGTVGTKGSLSGPDYAIPHTIGKTVGNNLFHSFDVFNINRGETATFTGPNTTQNVISRVTGGTPSTINGTLRSQVGTANFYFLNPAGVIFGPSASVDVPGAFHVTTANELLFTDGSKFSATNPSGSNLTAATPEAFGFLGRTGDIQINNGQLTFKEGTNVNVAGSSITSTNATLEIPKGNLRIYGQGDTIGTIPLTGPLPAGNGTIAMKNSSWRTSGDGAGAIYISGDKVEIKGWIDNDNTGSQHAAGILQIEANTLSIDSFGAYITSDAQSQGNAGKINLKAQNLSINQGYISSKTNDLGNAGQIKLDAPTININEGYISSEAYGSGNAGEITIKVQDLNINKNSYIYSSTNKIKSPAYAGQITILDAKNININSGYIASATHGKGPAGAITITTDNLTFTNGGYIGTQAKEGSTGPAGLIEITVTNDATINKNSYISSNTHGQGNAGQITLKAQNIKINAGLIYSNTRGQGDAGQITLKAQNIQIDNGSIYSDTYYKLDNTDNVTNADNISWGGYILIEAKNIEITNNSYISSETYGTGNAGNISIDANGSLSISDGSKISSNSIKGSNSGRIQITAGDLFITNTGHVTTSADFEGNAGYIQIDVNNRAHITSEGYVLSNASGSGNAGWIEINAGKVLIIEKAKVTTTANTGNGGYITIDPPIILLRNGQITTSVLGMGGDGGDINISGGYMVMDTGFIQANTAGIGVRGGNININLDGIISSGGMVFIGGNTETKFESNSGVNVIQAAAPGGESGTIRLSQPDVSASAGLVSVSSSFANLNVENSTICQPDVRNKARLIRKGRGGMPTGVLDSGLNTRVPNPSIPKKHSQKKL
ncbi:hypothetical protein TI05_07140 [Achromatium sp. WMS3]|nr:hypothetical protein TI05_07140 [Achromatium sp. WMS3]